MWDKQFTCFATNKSCKNLVNYIMSTVLGIHIYIIQKCSN